ncbi:MAG: rod shape-determining protein RodA [Actinobacteria bacterium]|nr:rod shape-determining protein RodA [Actinomycetota bacterium]
MTGVEEGRAHRHAPDQPARTRAGWAVLQRADWWVLGSALVLSLLGALLVWSATRTRLLDAGDNPQSFFQRHLINLAVGLVVGLVTAAVDYRTLRASAPVVYLVACLGLVAVLLVGVTINGSHSWIVLAGGYQVQPAEFAKVGLVVSIAMLLTERQRREDVRRSLDVPLVLAVAAVPTGLIMFQPDLGTILVLAFTMLAVLTVAGVGPRWVAGLLLVGVIAVYGAVHFGVLKEYQLDRFRAFTHPHSDAQGVGYNTIQARIAIGDGGLTGSGLFKGSQTNGKFVPEQQTDFVFTVAGEELGFVGAGGVIALFGLLLWRALRIAARSPDEFGLLVAVGIAAWFSFQVFVNIGMTLGITPVTGLPLPFVSYGGSSMLANWIAVGLLLNMHRRSESPET